MTATVMVTLSLSDLCDRHVPGVIGSYRKDAPGRIRTFDFCLRRAALYPLSYGRLSPARIADTAPTTDMRTYVPSEVGVTITGMDTRSRGDIAEAAVLHALTRGGLAVWTPWSRFGACDLMVENNVGRIARVQVKSGRVREECVVSNCRSTDHGSGRKTYVGHVDFLVIHVPELEEQFVVPIEEACGFEVRLRLQPTRNNQRLRVRYARDYRLADWIEQFAAAASQALTPAA